MRHAFPLLLTTLLFTCTLTACDRSTQPQQPVATEPGSMTQNIEPGAPASQPATSQEANASEAPMPPQSDATPAEILDMLKTFPPSSEKVELTPEQWKEKLTDQEFYVLRESGTERAFTGDLLDNHETGIYTCGGCGAPLFSSHSKFKSGTGWPSFYQPIEAGRVGEEKDTSLGIPRTEVHCQRCGGHLGHVFNDGPEPTGLRYCINAVSLNFSPVEEN